MSCAIFFLKIENEIVKGKIAPGINSLPYGEISELKGCGNAFASIGFKNNLYVFPNPTLDVLKFKNKSSEFEIEQLQLEVFDMLGREITNFANAEGILPEETWEVNIQHLAAGVYIFRLSGRNGESNFKIVKQ